MSNIEGDWYVIAEGYGQEEANPWGFPPPYPTDDQHSSHNTQDPRSSSQTRGSGNVPMTPQTEERELDENATPAPGDDDIVIAVMGITGAGKSTFISILADQDVTVGHSLVSCTVNVGLYSFTHHTGRTVYLIDTPGFDDTTRSDTDILKEIAYFFAKLHAKGMHLSGVIYLHRITDSRIGGSALKNLRMFNKLCGQACLPNVLLTTTMWSSLTRLPDGLEIGSQREQELQGPQFWGPMVAGGSRIIRHSGSPDSARAVVDEIVSLNSKIVLDIQTELIDQGKSLDKTEAGKYLQSELLEAREHLARELEEYQKEMETAIAENDQESLKALKREKAALEEREKQRIRDRENLDISMAELAHEKDAEWGTLAKSASASSTSIKEPSGQNDSAMSGGPSTGSSGSSIDPESTEVRRKLEQLQQSMRESEQRHELEIERLRLSHEAEAVVKLQRLTEKSMLMQAQYERDRETLERRLKKLEGKNRKSPNRVAAFLTSVFGRYCRESVNSTRWDMDKDERYLAY